MLIVEPCALNRKLFRVVLEAGGFWVEEAADAAAGLEMAGRAPPDLILVGVAAARSDADAFDAVRRLKSDPKTAWVPILAVAACPMPEGLAALAAVACDALLTSPVPARRLLAQARRLSGLRPARVQPPAA